MLRASARAGAQALVVLVGLLTAALTRAQAWVPDVGDRTFSLSTQYSRVTRHLFSVDVSGVVDPTSGYLLGPGNAAYFGDVVAVSNSLGGEYVPARNIAVTAEMAYTTARYRGRFPESTSDDGSFHGALQDASLGVRYMARRGPAVLTPSLDLRFPLTDRNRFGHVGAGSRLTSLALGLNAGRSLDPIAPLAYVFASYARVFVEDVDGFSLDRNQASAGIGTFITRSLSAQAHFRYTDTVDGVDWWWADGRQLAHHDAAAKAMSRRAGLSSGLTLTRHMGLALSWETTLSGANVHAAQTLTAGLSWSFWKWRPTP